MSVTMSKQERVKRTLSGQDTDRVPLYDLLRNDAAFAHFSGEKLPELAPDAKTMEALQRIAGKAVDGFLDMTRAVGFGPVQELEQFLLVRQLMPLPVIHLRQFSM